MPARRHGLLRIADGMYLPRLSRVLARRRPDDLLVQIAHDEYSFAGAEQIGVERRLIAGALAGLVLLPLAIAVDVGDGDAFGAERPVEDGFLPGDAGIVG